MSEKQLFVLDTEDDSNGTVLLYNFYNGKKHFTFTNQSEALKFVQTFKKKVICWCVNLEYDAINLFRPHYDLPRWNFGKTSLVSAQWKNFLFYDTTRHWKMSVAEMGKHLNLPKLDFDPTSVEYCRRDCEITYKFVTSMLAVYSEIGLPVKSTLPSSTYNFWLNNYCPYRIQRVDETNLEYWKNSYYGGRTECFHIGEWLKPVHVIDVNSMYPFVMKNQFPAYDSFETKFDLDSFGITSARVECLQEMPVLPIRYEGKLIYPQGIFDGTWTNHELKYALSLGRFKIKKVHKSNTFKVKTFPFSDFITDFYTRRQEAKTVFMNLTLKLAMNSLYGKFGQGNERTKLMTHEKWIEWSDRTKNYEPVKILRGDMVLVTEKSAYPINTNFIWASYVTSYARIHLHKEMLRLKNAGAQVLYCDTDSIFFSGDRNLITSDTQLGGWKHEGTFKNANFIMPKMYSLGDEVFKAKGVPKKMQEIFIRTGQATFKRPVRLRESLRRDLTANVWRDHSKQTRSVYNKGVVSKTGKVTPLKF